MRMSPLFIVGMPRSGTTLLRAILNAGTDVYIPPESEFLFRSYPFYNRARHLTDKDYFCLSELFIRTSQRNGWCFKRPELVKLLKDGTPRNLTEVNDLIYRSYLDRCGYSTSRWGLKTPNFIFNLERVSDLYPDGKFIHIVRDGRDVYLSHRKMYDDPAAEGFGPRTILQSALYWVDGLRNVQYYAPRLGIDIIDVRYEDLLTAPADTVQRICDFLNIVATPKMWETYHTSERNRKNMTCSPRIHTKLKSGIDNANVNRYKSLLSNSQILLFDFLAEPYLRKYGYDCTSFGKDFPLRFARSILYGAAGGLNKVRYSLRDYQLYWKAQRNLSEGPFVS